MPGLDWLTRASSWLLVVGMVLLSLWVFVRRVPRSVWSAYSREEQRALYDAITHRSPSRTGDLARPEHKECFERYQKTLRISLSVLAALMALNVGSCVLSVAPRHLR